MNLNQLFAAVPAALLGLGDCEANAGQTIEEAGALACVSDKWDESQPDEGHRLVNFAGRCILIPDDPTMAKSTEDCAGKYEYMPDGSWKGSGTCTWAFKGGDKIYETWEEGSHLKEYVCKFRGGTGKYEGVSGGGTYTSEMLTDTLTGGRYKGKIELH
jgi:hypothetical protein